MPRKRGHSGSSLAACQFWHFWTFTINPHILMRISSILNGTFYESFTNAECSYAGALEAAHLLRRGASRTVGCRYGTIIGCPARVSDSILSPVRQLSESGRSCGCDGREEDAAMVRAPSKERTGLYVPVCPLQHMCGACRQVANGVGHLGTCVVWQVGRERTRL